MFINTLRQSLLSRGKRVAVKEHQHSQSKLQKCVSGAELDSMALTLAASLQQSQPGNSRIIVILDAGIDFVTILLACLYSGTIIIPHSPPKSKHDFTRLHKVIEDSAANMLVCKSQLVTSFANTCPDIDCYSIDELLSTSTMAQTENIAPPKDNQTAIIQYSSGSTSEPKGILVTYEMIAHNHAIVEKRWELSDSTIGLTWLPHWHDMGLFGGLLYPLLSGGWIITLSPLEFVKRPLNWLTLISDYKVTLSGGPPFAYDLVEKLANDTDVSSLDLRSWKTAYCGADYIPLHTYHNFVQRFSALGLGESAFFACYGMAEITLFAGGEPYNQQVKQRLVHNTHHLLPCYIPNNDNHISIFHVDSPQPLDDGQSGEICFSTKSALSGYLNTDLKGFTFAGKFWVRSGDYGFIDDELLYITGRLKDIIKVRGKTLFPIDFAILANEQYTQLNQLVFFMSFSKQENQEDLVFLIEHKHKDVTSITSAHIEHLQQLFNQAFGVFIKHIHVLPRGKMPKTTSGKVNRSAIDDAFLSTIIK